MDTLELLTRQTQDAYQWTNRLIDSVPYTQWDLTPENIHTNISWQTGHLIMSFYYHSVLVIAGHQPDIIQQIPLKKYDAYFTTGSPVKVIGQFHPEILDKHIKQVQQKSISIIQSLSLKDLNNPLRSTETPHPIAKTFFEAIDWNIKHTMWHCGQLGILKRVVDERFDFGLKNKHHP